VPLTRLPPGQVAAIVTSLEMRDRPRPRPLPDSDLRLVRWPAPEPAKYRALFRRVGEPWLWFSRLVMSDAELTRIIRNPGVQVFAVEDRAAVEVGMLELDFREPATCELSFFGLVPELAGRGHGRWLMAQALAGAHLHARPPLRARLLPRPGLHAVRPRGRDVRRPALERPPSRKRRPARADHQVILVIARSAATKQSREPGRAFWIASLRSQ
jgi:GNAT superfamily N-acetyltransferase